MSLLQKIIARAALGYAVATRHRADNAHAHPDCVPDWEGIALAAFPALIVFGACLADMLR
jgi:hypothetical protein